MSKCSCAVRSQRSAFFRGEVSGGTSVNCGASGVLPVFSFLNWAWFPQLCLLWEDSSGCVMAQWSGCFSGCICSSIKEFPQMPATSQDHWGNSIWKHLKNDNVHSSFRYKLLWKCAAVLVQITCIASIDLKPDFLFIYFYYVFHFQYHYEGPISWFSNKRYLRALVKEKGPQIQSYAEPLLLSQPETV